MENFSDTEASISDFSEALSDISLVLDDEGSSEEDIHEHQGIQPYMFEPYASEDDAVGSDA